MKTAELLEYLIPNAKTEMSGKQYTNAIDAIKRCINEAIKTDRENVSNHAKVVEKRSFSGMRIGFFLIDKDSIINAPNIELL